MCLWLALAFRNVLRILIFQLLHPSFQTFLEEKKELSQTFQNK